MRNPVRVLIAALLLTTSIACSGADGKSYGSSGGTADAGHASAATANEDALARRVFELTNNQRRGMGLRELAWCDACAALAHAHSSDMKERGFFDHVNPDGKDPFARMDAAGVAYSAAGENIAEGYTTAEDVMAAWMQSPGHRANILSAQFTELGVGVREGATPGPWWTQTFRTP